MIAMNSKPQNFLVFEWDDVAEAVSGSDDEVPAAERPRTDSSGCMAAKRQPDRDRGFVVARL